MSTGCKIESVGVKFPDKKLTTSEIVGRLKLKETPKLELLTGIASRRHCGKDEDSLTLAVEAARDCFIYSAFKPAEIEMIIYCSISRYVNGINHTYEPALSILIKKELGITQALNFDISNACAGMITGVHIANNFISRGVVKNCLVVSGEFISSISNNAEKNINSKYHPELASLTVGDAGAAVILCRTDNEAEQIIISDLVTLSKYSRLCIGNQSCRQPGGIMKTQMKKIHDVSIENAPARIAMALKNAGLTMKQIDFMIPHQTSKHSIRSGARSFAACFGEEPGQILLNLENCGNTASTTHFTVLYKALKDRIFKEGDRIMLLSFASGIVIGIVIFSIHGIIKNYGNDH